MLTVYLKELTNFFNNIPIKLNQILNGKKNWEIIVAALIFRHIGQLVCNGHAINDFLSNPNEYLLNPLCIKPTPQIGTLHKFFKNMRLFTAIFPDISILNHSCKPNIANR